MRKTILLSLLGGAVAGCAGPAPPPPAGNTVAAIVGTPVYLAVKGPFCVVTVALAAPLAGLSGFAPTAQSQQLRRGLGDGVAENCGPPYLLTP